jgi:hypothetical protein
MPTMCHLIATSKGEPIYVNPLNVYYVRPHSPGNSVIHFGNDQSIGVAMDVQGVIHALDVAMNSNTT